MRETCTCIYNRVSTTTEQERNCWRHNKRSDYGLIASQLVVVHCCNCAGKITALYTVVQECNSEKE